MEAEGHLPATPSVTPVDKRYVDESYNQYIHRIYPEINKISFRQGGIKILLYNRRLKTLQEHIPMWPAVSSKQPKRYNV